MDKYCVGHGVEYGGSFCPACDLQVKLDEMTRFEAAKESDLQVECGETERLKAELDEMARIDAKLFNDLRAERDQLEKTLDAYEQDVFPRAERRFADAVARAEKAEAEVERLREALLKRGLSSAPCDICGYNGSGYYQSNTHACVALRGEGEK